MSVSLGMWSLKSSTELTRNGMWQDNTWKQTGIFIKDQFQHIYTSRWLLSVHGNDVCLTSRRASWARERKDRMTPMMVILFNTLSTAVRKRPTGCVTNFGQYTSNKEYEDTNVDQVTDNYYWCQICRFIECNKCHRYGAKTGLKPRKQLNCVYRRSNAWTIVWFYCCSYIQYKPLWSCPWKTCFSNQ